LTVLTSKGSVPVVRERFFHRVGRHDMNIKVATTTSALGSTWRNYRRYSRCSGGACRLWAGACGTFERYSHSDLETRAMGHSRSLEPAYIDPSPLT